MMTREYLENFGIHELRLKGREVGVKSPASKRKEDLIDEIIAIENGFKPAYRTNMGRKPKRVGVYSEELKSITQNLTLSGVGYANVPNNNITNMEFSSEDIPHINVPEKFMGIAREIGEKIIITNYLDGNHKYILLPRTIKDIKCGDLVKGTATEDYDGIKLNSYEVIKLSANENIDGKIEIIKYKDEQDICNHLKTLSSKLLFEAEADSVSKMMFEKEDLYYFSTPECADVALSFNMMLDCQNLTKRLVEKNEGFTLCLKNIQYIFSILSAFFSTRVNDSTQYINAGQIFKVIFSLINKSKNAKVIIFEKDNTKYNPYLDIILERYTK